MPSPVFIIPSNMAHEKYAIITPYRGYNSDVQPRATHYMKCHILALPDKELLQLTWRRSHSLNSLFAFAIPVSEQQSL